MGSKRFTLDGTDLQKLLVGAGMAAAGAVLTYISENISGFDFGNYTPVVVAGWGIVANFLRKLITDYSKS